MDYTFIEQIKQKLRSRLKPERYEHTLRTLNMAMELSMGTEADKEVVFMAALLHDCAKYREPSEEQKVMLKEFLGFDKVLHAPLGAILAREEYGITDERICNAICYHATGREAMTVEEKIVCLADAIEDGRGYPHVENIRECTGRSINEGLIAYFQNVLEFEKGNKIHPLTASALQYLKNQEKV